MFDEIIEMLEPFLGAAGAVWRSLSTDMGERLVPGLTWMIENLLPESLPLRSVLLVGLDREGVMADIGAFALIFTLLLFLLLLRRVLWRRRPNSSANLYALTRRPRFFGFACIFLLVVFAGGWSTLAPLASASIAAGVVSPEGSRKTIEHLEGGIVRTIHVREGDTVETGDILLTMDDVQALAQYDQLRKRYLHLLATEARLLAERSAAAAIVFPDELAKAPDSEVAQAIRAQAQLFESRRATMAGRERVLGQRVSQLEEQNAGLREVLAAQGRQIDLLQEEISTVETLLASGLAKMPRLLALRRANAQLEAEQAENRAKIAENGQKIGEAELQLLTMREEVVQQADDQLAEIQRILGEIRSQIPSREDILKRTVIRAPLSGSVMNIRVTTETGVLPPGSAVLDIVPVEEALVINAKVKPGDIDRVHAGMEARVILTAYKQRNLPLIHGTLRTISADRLVEDRTGESYFLAKVDVRREDLRELNAVRLLAGMPAEIMLLDDKQTFLAYLISPFTQSLNRSFREN